MSKPEIEYGHPTALGAAAADDSTTDVPGNLASVMKNNVVLFDAAVTPLSTTHVPELLPGRPLEVIAPPAQGPD